MCALALARTHTHVHTHTHMRTHTHHAQGEGVLSGLQPITAQDRALESSMWGLSSSGARHTGGVLRVGTPPQAAAAEGSSGGGTARQEEEEEDQGVEALDVEASRIMLSARGGKGGPAQGNDSLSQGAWAEPVAARGPVHAPPDPLQEHPLSARGKAPQAEEARAARSPTKQPYSALGLSSTSLTPRCVAAACTHVLMHAMHFHAQVRNRSMHLHLFCVHSCLLRFPSVFSNSPALPPLSAKTHTHTRNYRPARLPLRIAAAFPWSSFPAAPPAPCRPRGVPTTPAAPLPWARGPSSPPA